MLDNCLTNKISNLNDKTRECTIFISIFFMLMLEFVPLIIFRITRLDTIFSFFLCILIIVMSFDGTVRVSKQKKTIIILCLILGIFELIAGVSMRSLGYIVTGMFYTTVPVFMTVIINSKKQMSRIIHLSSVAMVIAFFILFILSIILVPLGNEQYESIYYNPNTLGMYSCIGFAGSLYLSVKENKYRYYAILGIALGFIYFSRARTAMLFVLGALLVILFYMLVNKKHIRINKKNLLLRICSVILFVLISFAGVSYINDIIGIRNAETVNNIESVFDVNITKNDNVEGDINNPEFLDVMASGINRSLKGIADNNSFTSGRIEIWKTFFDKLSLKGHENGTLNFDGADLNAHNAYLQVAYSYGIIPGIVYIVISIYILIVVCKHLILSIKKKQIDLEDCFVVILYGGFIVYSVLETAVSPFAYFFTAGMSICVLPYIGNTFFK